MQVPSPMDQEIAYLQRRHQEGAPFLVQELTALQERYVAEKALLDRELQNQIDTIEAICNNIELMPEVANQIANLKNMAQTILNQQHEKKLAIDVALKRLKIEQNDCVELAQKLNLMQRKCDSMPKNPLFGAMKSLAQRGNYRIASEDGVPDDFREVG